MRTGALEDWRIYRALRYQTTASLRRDQLEGEEAKQHEEQPIGGVERSKKNPELGGGRPTIAAVLPGEDAKQAGGRGVCDQRLLH